MMNTNNSLKEVSLSQEHKNTSSARPKRHDIKNRVTGDIGETVAKHEEMILRYYKDVQADQSFKSAKRISKTGFAVLIATLVYTLVFNALAHFKLPNFISNMEGTLTVASIGVVSGLLIEFIAGVNFWLYARASKQFNAFHICLERTRRYLLSYKISDKMKNKRDETLSKLVHLMATAPMLSSGNIDDSRKVAGKVSDTDVQHDPSKVEPGTTATNKGKEVMPFHLAS
jgi:Cyanobacterial TRADD-N associated 2-Transmembrane domain